MTKEGDIVKLNSCSDEFFISPIVITVKENDTIKLALDSKIINKSIHKNKYQMPNIDTEAKRRFASIATLLIHLEQKNAKK